MKATTGSRHELGREAKRIASLACLAAMTTFIATPAQAYDWAITGAHIVHIEATYMPTTIPFNVDKAGGSCTAGATLTYTGHGADTTTAQANTKAIYALLLAARVSGTPVDLYGDNSNCTVNFVYLD